MKKFTAKELQIKGKNIRFIGDPHLGRKFENGVPLDRRGERETWQMHTFEEQLIGEGVDAIIIVGDLFDKFRVSNEVLMRTAKLLISKALVWRDTEYYVLKGNHDLSRDTTLVSSFDLLKHMVDLAEIANLTIVDEIGDAGIDLDILFFPYDAQRTGEECIDYFLSADYPYVKSSSYDLVVGHWDLEAIAGKIPHNMIPTEKLKKITNLAVTGHYHEERWNVQPFTEFQVLCTGSMKQLFRNRYFDKPDTILEKNTTYHGKQGQGWCDPTKNSN
jgi:hypothetical protein